MLTRKKRGELKVSVDDRAPVQAAANPPAFSLFANIISLMSRRHKSPSLWSYVARGLAEIGIGVAIALILLLMLKGGF